MLEFCDGTYAPPSSLAGPLRNDVAEGITAALMAGAFS